MWNYPFTLHVRLNTGCKIGCQHLFIPDDGKKIPKKIAKKFKKLKHLIPALFLAKTGCDRPRKIEKNFSPEFRSYSTPARKFRKKIAKKFLKLKNLVLALFLAKTGWDRPRKRKKKFSPEFRSYTTQARKFRKKFIKLKNLIPALILAKIEWDRPIKRKKNLVKNSDHTCPGQESSERNSKKNSEN